MHIAKYVFGAVLGTGLFLNMAVAKDGFHPTDNCYQFISTGSPATKTMVASWMFGYIGAKEGDLRAVGFDIIE